MYMRIVDKYYGYPVISHSSDDFNSVFDIQVDSIELPDEEVLLVKTVIELEDREILKLISENKIVFTIHFEESKTCYREIVQFKTLKNEFKIPFGKVRDKIEVCGFLTTTTEIKGFKSDNMHPFYKNMEVNYEPYQIIGFSSSIVIDLVKEEDEIKEPKSIFAIISNKDENSKTYELDWNENRIIIKMPENDFKIYGQLSSRNLLQNQTQEILLAKIVMPVMVEAFNLLKNSIDLYSNLLWFKSIVKTFKDKNINIEKELDKESFDAYKYAQILFDSIYPKALQQVVDLINIREDI